MTKSDLIDDLELRLSSAKPSDDINISRRQLSDWVDMARDSLISSTIDNNFDRSIIKKESFEDVLVQSSIQGDKYYIELSCLPLSNRINSGIISVTSDCGDTVYEENIEDLNELKQLCFSKPSSSNLIYYVEGNKLFIEGLTSLSYTENDFIVRFIPSEVDRGASETSSYYLSPSDKEMVLRIAYEIGAEEIFNDFSDTENDGE